MNYDIVFLTVLYNYTYLVNIQYLLGVKYHQLFRDPFCSNKYKKVRSSFIDEVPLLFHMVRSEVNLNNVLNVCGAFD